MSIATLKKKTNAKYNNMSVSQKQFSINGTHRSQGYIGQDMLSRSFPRTPMRGNVAIGHGGCCGKYPFSSIVYGTGIVSFNDPNVVKTSVINTNGMLANKYKYYYNHFIVKPTPSNISYQDHINQIKHEQDASCNKVAISNTNCTTKCTNSWFTKHYQSSIDLLSSNTINYVKNTPNKVFTYNNGYLLQKNKSCLNLDNKFIRPYSSVPLPTRNP